jgi:hypothetical protein
MDKPARDTPRLVDDLMFSLMGYWYCIPFGWFSETPVDTTRPAADQTDESTRPYSRRHPLD